jgi:hypothetical protein
VDSSLSLLVFEQLGQPRRQGLEHILQHKQRNVQITNDATGKGKLLFAQPHHHTVALMPASRKHFRFCAGSSDPTKHNIGTKTYTRRSVQAVNPFREEAGANHASQAGQQVRLNGLYTQRRSQG